MHVLVLAADAIFQESFMREFSWLEIILLNKIISVGNMNIRKAEFGYILSYNWILNFRKAD